MNTLLTIILYGQLLMSVGLVVRVVSSSELRKLPALLGFCLMNLLLILLLQGIWYNLSYFMSISRGQEVTLRSTESTGMVLSSAEKSQTWQHMVKHSI